MAYSTSPRNSSMAPPAGAKRPAGKSTQSSKTSASKPVSAKSAKSLPVKTLRQIGHQLQPIVMIGGSGLTDNILQETLRALNDHELIKVKIAGEDRELRQAIIAELAHQTGAEIVQQVGKMVLLLKAATEPNPKLSNLLRFGHLAQ